MKKIIICVYLSCFALALHAQGVFQASIGIQSQDGDATLFTGKIWFQVENGEVEFEAYLNSFGNFTSSLNPILSVPGGTLQFSLGDGSYQNLNTFGDYNPFLPKSLPPTGYDCDGNPVYVYASEILSGDFYSGKFALPPGFLDELLAGNGTVQFNSLTGGKIIVDAVPEPSPFAMMTGGLCLLVGWLRFKNFRQRGQDSLAD